MAAAVDLGYLAAHLGMPEENLSTAVTQPSVDLVSIILSAVAARGHEYDTISSQKIQLEVEIETSIRAAEAQRDKSNETAAKALKDVEEIRNKLKDEETTRQALENELQSIKSSSSASQSDLEKLRARITSLETSNRESLAIIDTKNKANDTLSQELQAQHQKNLDLGRQIAAQQQVAQEAERRANEAKYQAESLKLRLDAEKRNAEFYEKELNTKNAEFNKLRKEKNARIAELQRRDDESRSENDALKKTEQQLRQRLDEAQRKADEVLTKIQKVQEAAARNEQGLQEEIASLRRLVDLKEQQTRTHKNRVQEVETREDQVKRECEDQIRRINEELERVKSDYAEASEKKDMLELELGQMRARFGAVSSERPDSAPQTPRLNGSIYRPGSPMGTPGTAQKLTNVVDENYRLKSKLAIEQQRSSEYAKTLDDLMEQLEAKGPELDDLQADNERLKEEIKNMSLLSDESFRERDSAKKAQRKAENAASTAQAEVKILRNQMRDMGAQIQMLVFNIQCLEKGQDTLTLEESLQLQRLARGQAEEGSTDEVSDLNGMILERLAVFKDITELREKNEQLLRVVHDLAEKMENEEAIAAKNQALQDHKEVTALRQKLQLFEDQLRGLRAQASTITQERNLFRRMVEARTSTDNLNTALGQSTEEGVLASIEQNSAMNDDGSDYTTLLRDLQQNFDQYRNEQTIDRQTMKEQVDRLSVEKNSLQAENAKISSQLSLASERYQMLHSNFTALQTENKELKQRNQKLSEDAAKQDLQVLRVSEEMVEAKGLADSMRNENANLKAEKKLWDEIQERLRKENQDHLQEKSRLNSLLATQQTLQNERDHSEAETKRRLQNQIESLEADLNATRRKLAGEEEAIRNLQSRKEYDAKQSQKRIDELTANLSQIREELVATKTSKEHLQVRVDELTIALRSAEERSERLQPRPTPRPGSMLVASEEDTAADTDERIQELIHESADLKRELDITKTHLENAQAQVEQYRELSQASEDELERMTATQEQYTQDTESRLAAKDATIKELEQRVEDLSSELTRSNNELSTLRDSQADVARHHEEEKAMLDGEIKRLKDEEEKYLASSQFHQQDLRAQAEIATNAQQAYEAEVMKHGETAKTLYALRAEYNQLKTAAASARAEAESAKVTLLQSEGSWDERRQKFEQELSDLRTSRDNANAQNKLLHQELENVSSQVSTLQHSRESAGESLEAIASQPSGAGEDKFRELASYLRREKDILEVQYDLKAQEAKRLQQQYEYAQSQLDEARVKLEQERRSQADSDRSSMAQKDLMAKLEELNLFRESSAALRAEAREAQARLAEKAAKVTELETTIQPLEAQIEELQSQLGFKEAEMKQLQEDRDRWQKRTEDILSRHGRTDPAEVEELKQTVANLEAERNALREAEAPLKEKIQQLEKTIEEKESNWQVVRERLINSAKEKARSLMGQKNEIAAERDQLQVQLNDTNGHLATTRDELEGFRKDRVSLEEQLVAFKRQVEALQEEARKNTAPTAPLQPDRPDVSNSQEVSDLQSQLTKAQAELGDIKAQKASIDEELQTLRGQLATALSERDQAIANAQMQAANGDVPMQNGDGTTVSQPPPTTALSDDERKALEEKVAAAEAKAAEYEAKAKEAEESINNTVKARSDKMKESLNKRLNDYKSQMESEKAQLSQEKEKLESDFKLRVEQERKIWEAEHSSMSTQPPATPIKQAPSETPGGTPSTSLPDLSGLSDKEIRDLLSNNTTLKSIVQNNVRNKLAAETKKLREELEPTLKAEWEQKIVQAREQATKLASSKSSLQLNMAENRNRVANAKLSVVEKAAKEVPQRPVGEVWNEAKDAKPPPPPPAVPKQPAPAAAPTIATGLPLPSSVGNRGRGGARGGRGGRGGGQQGRASLNPSVENFQPGAKRPRNDSDSGNGPKRARGGGQQ
ncbi:Protein mlp1 [Diatrype stigma]|uniref:Protein mlp1 n=1 Tax=Diatrype stigma TaxID=117547 RepID=A0AAN9YIC9_9PEZI